MNIESNCGGVLALGNGVRRAYLAPSVTQIPVMATAGGEPDRIPDGTLDGYVQYGPFTS